jgi:Predicted glycosyl hydrolase
MPPQPSPRESLTSAQAASAFASFTAAFYAASNGQAYYHTSTLGGHADFWKQAEMIEMVEDAYAATRSPSYQRMVVDLLAGARSLYGRNWLKRTWNDDIMWMVIAYLRAYQITGNKQYLAVAKQNFDGTYARGWSNDLGGGLWWTTANTQKNVTTNCPAAIAACLLYHSLHDQSYLQKAIGLYGWVRANLYDPSSGIVRDSITVSSAGAGQSTVMDPSVLSYNQGTFIGAADLLHAATGRQSYYNDALSTLRAARLDLTTAGIMRSESPGGNVNGGGFKGIFCRWAVKFTRDDHITSFDPWFRLNAETALANRDGRGLIGQDWARPTPNGVLFSFDCSSAVVLLEMLTARP